MPKLAFVLLAERMSLQTNRMHCIDNINNNNTTNISSDDNDNHYSSSNNIDHDDNDGDNNEIILMLIQMAVNIDVPSVWLQAAEGQTQLSNCTSSRRGSPR